MATTATTPTSTDAAIGWFAWLGAGSIAGLTAIVLLVRKLASWFKANYWHAFVLGMLAAWVMLATHDVLSHPLTWAAWSAQTPTQKMIGLPVTMPTVSQSDAVVAPVKPKKTAKKAKSRPHDALADFKPF